MVSQSTRDASRLRRQLHDAVSSVNLEAIRDTLHTLYEDAESPLGDESEIATPAAYAALVEVSCLATAHAALHPDDAARQEIASEMEQNVERLRVGFNVDALTFQRVRNALDVCEKSGSIDEAHAATLDALTSTPLEKRVKVARHSVSYAPGQRSNRAQSPTPSRFDDV